MKNSTAQQLSKIRKQLGQLRTAGKSSPIDARIATLVVLVETMAAAIEEINERIG